MENYVKISSKENEKYKFALSLLKPNLRKKTNSFLVEGWRAVSQAKENSIPIEILFVTEDSIQKYGDEIREIALREKIFLLDEKLYRALSDTIHSQGILAVCTQKKEELSFEKERFILILDRVQDPGNLGTLLRTALAYGVDKVVLTKGSVDAFSAKVTRSSLGANLCIPLLQQADESTILHLKEKGYPLYCAALSKDAVDYRRVEVKSRVALVLGNEANGIDRKILEHSDHNIVIPIKGEMESLNVSIAGGILMNEFYYILSRR